MSSTQEKKTQIGKKMKIYKHVKFNPSINDCPRAKAPSQVPLTAKEINKSGLNAEIPSAA